MIPEVYKTDNSNKVHGDSGFTKNLLLNKLWTLEKVAVIIQEAWKKNPALRIPCRCMNRSSNNRYFFFFKVSFSDTLLIKMFVRA